MDEATLHDATGRRRSPATMPEFHRGRPPRNKGRRYPADPPRVEDRCLYAAAREGSGGRSAWTIGDGTSFGRGSSTA
jgi:hypothetical protein